MNLKKFNSFTNDIIFVDGMWGTGKSIVAPIISAMEGVEKQKIEYIYEYLCIALHLGKIEPDTVDTLLNTYADMSQYNNLVGREVNLRWNDDTGPKNNPNSLRYIKRMFSEDGDSVVKKINHDNLALNLMSHMIFQVSEPLMMAFGDRLKIIEMVRHPLYMISHWNNYMLRFDAEREFTISIDFNGEKVPWFACSWKEEYLSLSLYDRCLAAIIDLYDALFSKLLSLGENKEKVLVITFEDFVLNPEPCLESISVFLNRSHNKNISKILKKQKVPRNRISLGKGHASYGWERTKANSETEEYIKLYDSLVSNASAQYLQKFNSLIEKYNSKWPTALSSIVSSQA